MVTAAKVGALLCQRQPFSRELVTRIISCDPVKAAAASGGGKKDKKKGDTAPAGAQVPQQLYDIILEDSVLFPEGGGQPCDYGTLNGSIPVRNVQRRGDQCVLVDVPVPPVTAVPPTTANGDSQGQENSSSNDTAVSLAAGDEVNVAIDWDRRFDHMQHHSGQHLLTAVLEKALGLPTESWSLSYPTCYVQLTSPNKIAPEELARVENLCNTYIRESRPVKVITYGSREELPPARSRGIPKDVTGPIRLIDINDIDCCTCCGTHVESLQQLQVLKLLHQEQKGNTTKLHFIYGARVLREFTSMYERERALARELGIQSDDIVPRVEKRGKDLNEASKAAKKLMGELAELLGDSVSRAAAATESNKYFVFHREDADMDFLQKIGTKCKEAAPQRASLLYNGKVTGGGGGATESQFLIVGGVSGGNDNESDAKRLCQIVCTHADGKGGGRPDQGIRGKCDAKKLKQYLSSPHAETDWQSKSS